MITSKGVIGTFYHALENTPVVPWVNMISTEFKSDSEFETYAWLGQAPAMQKWIGSRKVKKLREDGQVIYNDLYESTLGIPVDWMRRDKTGQIQIRVNQQVEAAQKHWPSLLTNLISKGDTQLCYDGQYYFDTDHSEGNSGTQSNMIAVPIANLPVQHHGSITSPSVGEMSHVIYDGISQIQSLKDDQGEPMNESATGFVVMSNTKLSKAVNAAINAQYIDSGNSNLNTFTNFNITAVSNPRLDKFTNWNSSIAVFRVDGSASPLIHQSEFDLELSVLAEGSELEHRDRMHEYGIAASRGVGYGYWQYACKLDMVA